jgi:hypothetical protein
MYILNGSYGSRFSDDPYAPPTLVPHKSKCLSLSVTRRNSLKRFMPDLSPRKGVPLGEVCE